MIFRIMPSDPEYEVFAFLSHAIAALTNPHVHFDLRGMPDTERLADLAYYTAQFEELTH
jgi:hypothetical protein